MLPKISLFVFFFLCSCFVYQSDASTFGVSVGDVNVLEGYVLYGYFPSSLTINLGDTIDFKINIDHSVTFLNGKTFADYGPFANCPPPYNNTPYTITALRSAGCTNPYVYFPSCNGRLGPPTSPFNATSFCNSGVNVFSTPTTWSLTMGVTGTFTFYDLIYRTNFTLTVLPAGSPLPLSVSAVASLSTTQLNALRATVNQSIAEANAYAKAQQFEPSLDGAVTYNVLTGWVSKGVNLLKFIPQDIVVRPNDVVRFMLPPLNENGLTAPHVVTFPNGNTPAPWFNFLPWNESMPYPFSDFPGFPVIMMNITTLFATDAYLGVGGTAFAPYQFRSTLQKVGFYSTGLLSPPIFSGSNAVVKYEYKVANNFTGVLPYECGLHLEFAMVGTITVKNYTVPSPQPIYRMKQFSTDRDGNGTCSNYQYLSYYEFKPGVCTMIGEAEPFLSYFKVFPTNGPEGSDFNAANYVTVLRYDLFNALPACGLGPAITPPAVACFVPINGSCTVCSSAVQYRMSIGSALSTWALFVASLVVAAFAFA